MKNLKSFKKEKVELKSINGGGCGTYHLLWHYPGGASTEGNFVTDGRYDQCIK